MDSSMVESVFEDGGASSDVYSPEPKPIKASALPKKAIATAKAAPKKMTQTTLKPKAAAAKKRKQESDEENSDPEPSSVNDDSLLSNTPPSAKRQKKAPIPKKATSKPLQPINNESVGLGEKDDEAKPNPKKSASATDQYQKLTQLEHILKRPDTYIGSVERTEKEMWVYNSQIDAMESREVSFVPGLYKIFDEILVNAADNKQRDKNMDEIKVTIDREKGQISVKNNGKGIPIEIHSKEGIYIPEMIFGHLLTSSNYDDNQEKVTGGRNGYGAKLCNVFSTEFILETVDSKQGQRYKQVWTENMSKMGKAKITSCKDKDYTMITFTPDFSKFGMDGMDEDFEALVKRRVYDMAGTCKDVKISLNGEKLKVRTFKKYMEMYTKAIKDENDAGVVLEATTSQASVILTDNPHERWEVGFAVSDGSFQQVSFVNSIATTSGGTHVNYIADQIVDKLLDIVKKKKDKGGNLLKPGQIRNHMFLFVNCLITNPAFTSQTKEQLTTKASQFGSKCTLSEKFLKDIAKTEVVNNILEFAQKKADQNLKKSDGGKRTRMNNSKLTDANKAGTKDGWRCTLILTEGDSASLLALAGRAVVDPDLIGVFPLRGKLLNVRDASIDQISKNQEIQNIKKFMGLQHKKHYDDTRGLRYGHLMIMTDQDHDGSHIKGLLINFLEVQFPSLLKLPGFLKEFITPIVKVWKGDPKHPKKLQSFFTMPEYEAWKEVAGNARGWDHKYYKGLGTSSPADAEIYFRDLDKHLKEFHVIQPDEPELIDLAFSKKKADARKEWLRQFRPGTFLDMGTSEITYNDFINKELILFSMADNLRSIPSVIDGFKPGQRKVLYTCFRRNLKKDVKVVELAGSVSGLTAYAYGETSLQQTIVGLAQNFVGSNNINCLEPSGNFGSRLQGGADSASARYIYTRLSPFARKLFQQADEPLLTYNTDDGKTIEPECYVPILPMILVNGADGIGTGWSTSIPNYNPEDIVDNLKVRMAGNKDDMKPMKPWFRSWSGEAEDVGGDRYKFSGVITQTGENEVEITELPVRMWTQDFKDKLEEIIKAEKIPSFIKDYTEYNTPVRVHFIIKLEDKHMKLSLERGLEETFKLSKTMATTNLVAFDSQNRIHKYTNVLDIMEEFYHVRLRFYEKRKEFLLNEMQAELEKLSNQAKFIRMIVDNKLVVSKKKKIVLVAELRDKGFKAIAKISDARKEGEFEPVVENEDGEAEEGTEGKENNATDFDYLLGMAIWSLTEERIEKLMKQIGDKEVEMKALIDTSPKQLWTTDLDAFLAEWRFQLEDEAKRAKKAASMGRRASTKLRIGGKQGAKKRKADDSDASDNEFMAAKPTKAVVAKTKPKTTSSLFSFLTKPEEKPSTQSLVNAIEQKPVAKPPAVEAGFIADDEPRVAAAAVAKQRPESKRSKVLDDDSDDDVFAVIAQEAKSKDLLAPGREGRAASRKPVKYAELDDSSDGNDLLGDVSNMVKGISRAGNDAASKPLFAATTRQPSVTHTTVSKSKTSALSDIEDETDYRALVPKDSPQKPAVKTAREVLVSGDEDDSFDVVPTVKAALKAPPAKATTTTKKVAPVVKASKVAPPVTKLVPKKAAPQSPAAKAYAAKLAKAKATTSGPSGAANKKSSKAPPAARKKKVASDDEDEDEDMEDIVNDILNDDDSDADIIAKGKNVPASAPAARPTRRAAAANVKSKYVVDLDDDDDSFAKQEEEEQSQSEGEFDDEGSD